MKAILIAVSMLALQACTVPGLTIQQNQYNPIGDIMPAPLDCNTQTGVCGWSPRCTGWGIL